jgi:uncharacterized membrane protein
LGKHKNRNRNNPAGPSETLTIDQPPHHLQAQVTSVSYQGLLPPPEMLAQFNQVIPNGADRIVTMTESQIHHRQALETRVVNGNVSSQKLGQLYAFLLGVLAIGGGIGLIAFNKPVSGLVSIITAFTSLAGIFIYGRYDQKQERERKRRELEEAARQRRLPLE